MILTIPRAQSLRFVNLKNYGLNPYNHDSLLLQDEGRIRDEPLIYFQKFDTNDNIIVQIISDYSNDLNNTLSLTVYDSANTLQQTVTLVDQNAGLSNAKVWQGTIDTSLLGGIYYAKILASGIGLPTFNFQSEYFEIDDFSELPKIEWKESDYSGLYFGAGAKFGFRIEADITGYQGGTETESFEAFNSVEVNLKTTTKRIVLFQTDEIPRYIYEKLVLGFAHKKVYINDVEYVGLDSPKAEPVQDTQFYFFEREITQANYEVYDVFEAASGGDDPTPGEENIISSEGVDIIVDDLNTLLIPY